MFLSQLVRSRVFLGFLAVVSIGVVDLSRPCLAQGPESPDCHIIRSRGSLSGALLGPSGKIPIRGEATVEYTERVLDRSAQGEPSRTVRVYAKTRLVREQGDQIGEGMLRPVLNPVVILRQGSTEVPFSPKGPLTLGEVDLLRTDVFVGALAGLLPPVGTQPGGTWKASETAIRELTDLETVARGGVDCSFEAAGAGRPARTVFRGTVEGVQEEGMARHLLSGSVEIGPDGGLRVLDLQATQILLGPDGSEKGTISGRFALERIRCPVPEGLTDAALAGMKLSPDETNTRLQVEVASTGLGFTMSRRWRIVLQEKNQIRFALPGGAETLLTLEGPGPDGKSRLPTLGDILGAGSSQLEKNGFRVGPSPAPVPKTGPRQIRWESSQVEARKADGVRERWVYAVIGTANQGAGAILAARFPAASWPLMDGEIAEMERLAFSLYAVRGP